MAQKTNLNVSPYYDDFDPEKNFYKVLFKPGIPVQARELTTLQSFLQEQIGSLGSNIFKDGSVVIPGNVTYDPNYYSVKINPLHLGLDVEFYTNELIGKKISGQTSQISAIVQNVVKRTDSSVGETTLYVKYLGSNSNLQISTFVDGETLIAQETFAYGNTSITSGSTIATLLDTNATSTASAVSISPGIYFIRGFFVNVAEDTLILDQYTNTPSYRIGLSVLEEFITSNDDSSLFDNAKGFSNYSAPGADRLKIGTMLSKKSLTDFDDKDFIELIRITNGEVKKIRDTSNYAILNDYFAKRTYDQSGNFSITPFQVDPVDSLNNLYNLNGLYLESQKTESGNTPSEDLISIKITPGKAYVGGYEIEKPSTTILDVKKPRSTESIISSSVPFEMGTLIIVNNVTGTPALGIDNNYIVNLQNQRRNGNTSGQGINIGKARVYSFSISDAPYSNGSTRWNLYLYDIQTYTVLNLNASVTSLQCPETSYVKGLSSGASGYVVGTPSGNSITLTQISGTFISGEQILINNNTNVSRSISSIISYGVQDIKSIYQNSTDYGLQSDFVADTFLEKVNAPNFSITDNIIVQTNGTVTSPGKNFVGIKSDAIIRYQIAGLSTETYNRVVSVSSDGLSMTVSAVPDVNNVCVGQLPSQTATTTFNLGIPSIKNEQNSYLYANLANKNISNVDLSNSQLVITEQLVGKSTSASGTLSLSINSDVGISSAYFQPFNTERYSIFYSDGSVDNLSQDKFTLTNGGQTVSFSGLKVSQSNVTVNVTISKNIIKNKKKLYKRSQILEVNKSSSGVSTDVNGLIQNNFYGLRVQDEEICLNVPDVVKVLSVYESLDSNSVVLDSLSFPSGLNLDINSIVGEKIIGATSNAIGQIVSATSSTINFVYLNSNKFVTGETVKFNESKISSSITLISFGSYFNRTGDFVLDKGQKNQYYDYSKIVRKNSNSTPSKKLLIVYDSYEVPSDDKGDVYTANSYDQERFKNDIPVLGSNIRSSDTLDFRPRVAKFNSIGASPFSFTSRNFSTSGVNPTVVVSPNESASVGYSYYVPRTDKVSLDKDGNFKVVLGSPSLNPKPPYFSNESMDVAIIEFPAYLYDIHDAKVIPVENKRYTMKDISTLENRIKKLEDLTSLTLLELDTKSLQITDNDGITKYKTGFFVDSFKDNNFIDIQNPDANATVLKNTQELTTDVFLYSVKSQLSLNNSLNSETADFSTNLSLLDNNVKKTGDLITLNYDETLWGDVTQNFATKEEPINPFGLTDYNGFVTLKPSSDTWVRTINNAKGVITRTQGEWSDNYISNLISSTEPYNKMRSRNIQFVSGNLLPLTQYFCSLDGKSDIDIIPKLLQISMVSGTFQVGEIVEGYVGNTKVCSFRLATADHKFGSYNNPTEKYVENPYSSTLAITSYSQSSSILNIDTYSLADDGDGRFFGYIPVGTVLVGKTSSAQAKSISQSLVSDSFGDLIGCFFIRNPLSNPTPTNLFNVGSKTFKVYPSSTTAKLNVNNCETTFYASGIIDSSIHANIIGVRRPIFAKPFFTVEKDPLTQTFKTDVSGGFLTSIDLFFSQKDDKEKLTLEIREVDLGGRPTNKIIQDFARVQISPSGISTSSDGEIATNVKLPSPLYLEPNKQYALCLNSPSSSKYKVWIAESNKPTVKTQNYPNAQQVIYSNQYVGGNLYKPQNGTTPISSQFEDLKFKFYKAKFSSSSGTVYFTNPSICGSNLGNNYDINVQKLVENPITMYPRKIVVGILTTYALDNILTLGRKVAEGTAYGYVEQCGGNIASLNVSNVGTGYSNGTFYNVPLYKINGYGPNNLGASANITFTNGSVSSVSIANSGTGFVAGDLLGITTSSVIKGKGGTLSVASRANIDTLYLTNMKGEYFAVGNTIAYYDNNTLVSLAGTTVKIASRAISDLYQGNVMKVHQYNHGMHSQQNVLTISGISPDTPPQSLTASITPSSTLISVADTSNFVNYEGMPISGINTGYVLVNNEVISYYDVGPGTLKILERHFNNTASRNHEVGDLVYKYELNGVSLLKINTTHYIANTSNSLFNSQTTDDYYLNISRANRQYGYNQSNFIEQKTLGGSDAQASQNFQYNAIIPQFNSITPNNTTVSSTLRSVSGTSVNGNEISFIDQQYEKVSLNTINNLTSTRLMCSRINEINNLSFMPKSKSTILGINLQSSNSNSSPVIDVSESATFILSRNRINNPISSYILDSRSNQFVDDPHSSIYISKKVTLLQPATSLKVITNTHRSGSSDFRVLYRLFKADSSEINQSYVLFPGYNNLMNINGNNVSNIVIDKSLNDGTSDIFVSANQEGEFSEYNFTAENLEQFTGFIIKIVMNGTDESKPLLFKDIRVVALA